MRTHTKIHNHGESEEIFCFTEEGKRTPAIENEGKPEKPNQPLNVFSIKSLCCKILYFKGWWLYVNANVESMKTLFNKYENGDKAANIDGNPKSAMKAAAADAVYDDTMIIFLRLLEMMAIDRLIIIPQLYTNDWFSKVENLI